MNRTEPDREVGLFLFEGWIFQAGAAQPRPLSLRFAQRGRLFSFTPGFSRVIENGQENRKPFKTVSSLDLGAAHLAKARCE